jgi:NitT/TauT family transport system ATP-binding protein
MSILRRTRGSAPRNDHARRADDAAAPVISVENVWFSYGSRTVIAGVSLQVQRGERVALLGSTGAGKSTVLNLLIGSIKPSSGQIRVAGLAPAERDPELFGKFSVAFQGPRLLPWRTTLDNVALGQEILGMPRRQARELAREWLHRVGLDDCEHLFPSQLSGGMRQRASLARAFSINPEVLFLDEAFSALDEVTADRLRKDFHSLSVKEGTTAVIVTHDIDEAMFLADRIVILGRPSRIIADFTAAEADWHGSADRRASVREEIVSLLHVRASDKMDENAASHMDKAE